MQRFSLTGRAIVLIMIVATAACSASTGTSGSGATTTNPTATAPTGVTTSSAAMDTTKLPLGDNHVATSPQVGYVDSCMTRFDGRGAFRDGPWIQGTTWNATLKVAVQGAITWPQAQYAMTVSGGQRVITTHDLPINGGTTGAFPIAASDPAFAYDRNPNTIRAQTLTFTLNATPVSGVHPACLPGGVIGVLTDGVALFDALDGQGRDAVAHEVLDACGGHPEQTGVYHHYEIPGCLLKTATSSSTLVGYALDGYGIYVERDAAGNLLTNASLDSCHGRVSPVNWDGAVTTMYHYDATYEYPYTLGCFMGTPVR